MTSTIDIRTIPIQAISIATRLRKHPDQIEALAGDIVDHGLINPITVMDGGDGSFILIAGLRRLEAMRFLGTEDIRATVLSPMDAELALALEYAENEQRQAFTQTERLDYAEKIKVVEQAKAHERKSIYARSGRDEDVPERAHPETKGRTRQIVAEKAGFTSTTQYERALAVARKRPELLDKIDKGEMSIFAAYTETMQATADTASDAGPSARCPDGADPHAPNDQVARAKHDRLMKNPLYAELHAKHIEAVKGMNTAKGELRFQVEGLQKVIRGHEENICAIIRDRDALRVENQALRQRLGLSADEAVMDA